MQTMEVFDTSSRPIRRQSNLEVIWVLSAFALLLLFTYPIAALAYSAFLLINLPSYTPARSRRVLAVVLFVATSMIMSLRLYGGESDDLASYYGVYQSIREGNTDALFVFAGGIEIGLPVVFYICTKLLPELTPNGLMLVCTLTSSTIFFFWVESTFYSRTGRNGGPLLMGVALMMLNIAYSTQVVRQFISLAILLYALSASSLTRRLVFLAVAASFHITAIPFFVAYWLGRRGVVGLIVIVTLTLAVRLYFSQLLAILDVLPPILADKLAYWVDNNAEYTTADLGSLKLLIQLCLISLAAFVWGGFYIAPEARRWHMIPWVTTLVHVSLLSIPLASLRTTLMVHSVATGIVAHKMIHPKHRLFILVLFNALLFYKLLGYASIDGAPAQTSSLEVILGALQRAS